MKIEAGYNYAWFFRPPVVDPPRMLSVCVIFLFLNIEFLLTLKLTFNSLMVFFYGLFYLVLFLFSLVENVV